jgi:hypothetical protein
MVANLKAATTSVATKYIKLKQEAKSMGKQGKNNTLLNLIQTTEEDYGLTSNSINRLTVKIRVSMNNASGFAPQRTSPISEIEPVLLKLCIMVTDMGNPLTRDGIIDLANETIEGTAHSERLSAFKNQRKLKNEKFVGARWYRGFIKRNSEFLKRSKCKIKDQNRLNWCNYQNFFNMYDGVYSAMVKAGVAIETPKERMYGSNGERVFDELLMEGRPTKFQLIKPENVIFVDEAGCNTNQNTDGHIGSELFVLSSWAVDSGVSGLCTDIHFSVLCFKNAEGDPIMFSIILKSMKEIFQLSANVRLGIDWSIEIGENNGESKF